MKKVQLIVLLVLLTLTVYLFYQSPLCPKKHVTMLGPLYNEAEVYYLRIKTTGVSPWMKRLRGLRRM